MAGVELVAGGSPGGGRRQAVAPAPAPEPLDGTRAAAIALRQFFAIAQAWGLSVQEELDMLGVGRTTLYAWKKGEFKRGLEPVTLERLSYVFNIYQALHLLFSDAGRANAWIRRPNTAPGFGGRPAFERMTSRLVADLYEVAKYVQAHRGGDFL